MDIIQKENNEIAERLKQSDRILCTHLENLHFTSKRENDLYLMSTCWRSLPMTVRNVEEEYQLWIQSYRTRVPYCSIELAQRYGNTTNKEKELCGGYECVRTPYNNTKVPDNTRVLFNTMTKRV